MSFSSIISYTRKEPFTTFISKVTDKILILRIMYFV